MNNLEAANMMRAIVCDKRRLRKQKIGKTLIKFIQSNPRLIK